jgi:hypothetical protein
VLLTEASFLEGLVDVDWAGIPVGLVEAAEVDAPAFSGKKASTSGVNTPFDCLEMAGLTGEAVETCHQDKAHIRKIPEFC